jgi:hypothetical protein
MIPFHDPETIRQYLQRRRISSWSIARRLEIDHGHLHRVLTGQRPGSAALLKAVAEMAEKLTHHRNHEEIHRLIDAATHVFFLKRGGFESDIFNDFKCEATSPRKKIP